MAQKRVCLLRLHYGKEVHLFAIHNKGDERLQRAIEDIINLDEAFLFV